MMDARVTPARSDIAAAHLRGKVVAERFVAGRGLVVTAAWMNLLGQPNGRVVSQVLHGDLFDVYDEADGFCWGQNRRDSYVGYVASSGLGRVDLAPNARVSTHWGHIYPDADMKSVPARDPLPFMAAVRIIGAAGSFQQVRGGYCPGQCLRPMQRHESDFVAVAESFIGVPYLWGGCTPLGFDCSGLVQISLLAAGKPVPRDTDQQAAAIGAALAADSPRQRGDLVFWKGHVGIMQDATRIIHANGHHMAVTSELLAFVAVRAAETGGKVTSCRRISF